MTRILDEAGKCRTAAAGSSGSLTGRRWARLWRDSGYAVGALISGITAALASLDAAIGVAAILTAASGLLAWACMTETHPRPAADSG